MIERNCVHCGYYVRMPNNITPGISTHWCVPRNGIFDLTDVSQSGAGRAVTLEGVQRDAVELSWPDQSRLYRWLRALGHKIN